MRFIEDKKDKAILALGIFAVSVLAIGPLIRSLKKEDKKPTTSEHVISPPKNVSLGLPEVNRIPLDVPSELPPVPVVTPKPTPTPKVKGVENIPRAVEKKPRVISKPPKPPTNTIKLAKKPTKARRVIMKRTPDVVSCPANYSDYYWYCKKLKRDVWAGDYDKLCR